MKTNDAAEYILAHVRIPHHTQISRWLDWIAGLQIAWMALGLVLLRKTPLFRTLLTLACGGLLLTLPLAVRENDQLSLVFPWRITVLLVPISTAIAAVKLAQRNRDNRLVGGLAFVLFLVQAAGGVIVMALGIGYEENEFELPLLQHVREHAGPSGIVIPTKLPAPTTKRGIESFTFTPDACPEPRESRRFAAFPPGDQGTAIYVDFKSVACADLRGSHEWQRRMTQVEKWYESKAGIDSNYGGNPSRKASRTWWRACRSRLMAEIPGTGDTPTRLMRSTE